MKIVCDACGAKYFVADDKIHRRVVRLTCQKCDHVITARREAEEQGGVEAADLRARLGLGGGKSAPKRANAVADWYYSKDGQSFGPFAKDELVAQFASKELGAECYVWHRALGAWTPAHSTPPFDQAIAEHKAAETGNPFADPNSGAAALLARSDEVSTEVEEKRPTTRVKKLKGTLDTLSAEGSGEEVSDDSDEDLAAATSPDGEAGISEDATTSVADAVDAEIDLDVDGASRAINLDELRALGMDSDSISLVDPMSTTLESQEMDVVNLDDDHTSTQGSEQSGWMSKESEEARKRLFSAIEQVHESGASHAPVERSMLIHIDHLRQQNRKVRLYAIFAVLGMAFIGVTIWAVMNYSEAHLEAEEKWQPGAALASEGGEEIDDAELERLAPEAEFTLVESGGESEGEFVFDSVDPTGEGELVASNEPQHEEKDDEEVSSKHHEKKDPKPKEDVSPINKFEGVVVDQEPKAESGVLLTNDVEAAPTRPQTDLRPSSLATGSRRRRTVDLSGTASLGNSLETKGSKYTSTTSRKVKSTERNRFKSGLKKVSKAVQECHQRQLKTGNVSASKIYLTVTVEPDGTTSKVNIDKAIVGTPFEECLLGKKDRWTFETFEGKAVELRQGFVLE